MFSVDNVLFAATLYVGFLSVWMLIAKVYAKFFVGGGGKLVSKTMCDGAEVFGIAGDRSTEVGYQQRLDCRRLVIMNFQCLV